MSTNRPRKHHSFFAISTNSKKAHNLGLGLLQSFKRGWVHIMLTCFLLATWSIPTQAQEQSNAKTISPIDIIDSEGRVVNPKGLTGTVDLTGFNLKATPNGPVLSPVGVMSVDNLAFEEFASSGPNNTIRTFAVSGTDIYVGGDFTQIDNVAANYIAKWDGTSWSALGSGMNNTLNTIAISGSDVYAGGQFTTAGGNAANRIAKWDGTSWSALGSGMNNTVNTIAISGSDVYAGGQFTNAGGNSASRIAKWNGSSWSALGTGMNNLVYTIAISGSDVYAGGLFTTAGGNSANRIAKWDGSSWSALGSGMSSNVFVIAISGGNVYAGGSFTTAGGNSANRIAKWDGTSWSALGTGMNSTVNTIAISGSDVYAGGSFTTAGGNTANRIAKWDGTTWSALGTGMNSNVLAIAIYGSDVYAGGLFTTAGGNSANRIAKWNGTSFSQGFTGITHKGVGGNVNALAISGSDVYAGGQFTTAGGNSANNIAKWDGSSWSALGTGMNDVVFAIAISGSDVYAVGAFTTAGGNSANRIAKWDGSSWSALGSGMSSTVRTIAVSGSDVYAGGFFTTAGGNSANRIAKWDGSSWSALGSGMNNTVFAIAISGSDVYAVGTFFTAGGNSASRVAKWDGTSWSALGTGMNSTVNTIVISGSDVYAGGQFTTAGGNSANRIAKWDGSSWSALGTGMSSTVNAIAVSGSDVFAGGSFTTAGGNSANYIAKWDGATWKSVGAGFDFPVVALAIGYGKLYAGGQFSSFGTTITGNFTVANWFQSQTSISSSPGFRMLASPVTTTYASLLEETWTQGATGADNSTGSPNVWTWNNSSSGWTGVTNLGTNLTAGNGFLYYHFNDDNDDGTSNAAPTNLSVSGAQNSNPTITINPNADGWTLVGNPFGASINWDRKASSNNIYANAQIWNPATSSWVTTSSNNLIAAFQSFFVQTFAASSPSLNIGTGAVTTGATFYGKQVEIPTLVLSGSSGTLRDEVVIQLHGDAQFGHDQFDAQKLTPLNGNFISLALEGEKGLYAQQAVPADGSLLEFPLVVDRPTSGQVTLTLKKFTLPDGYAAELHDINTNRTYQIDNDFELTVDILKAGKDVKNDGELKPLLLSTETASQFYVVIMPKVATSSEPTQIAGEFNLFQNYPNPFNPSTVISYNLPSKAEVRLQIFDNLGRMVSEMNRGIQAAGMHEISWDASGQSSGIYFYRIVVDGRQQKPMKMTLIK